MNAVQTFTFDVDSITHGIRVVEIDGAPWFVAQDAAAALGLYTAGERAVTRATLPPMKKW
ncbi:hypothetical protein [Azospirillum argentinense]